jgi:hypothetical protein
VLLPILDELVEARQPHKLLITTGGGTRARHAYAIATDLGMPTGVLAKLGSSISEQNALMVAILISQHGGIKLANYIMLGGLPVTHAHAKSGTKTPKKPNVRLYAQLLGLVEILVDYMQLPCWLPKRVWRRTAPLLRFAEHPSDMPPCDLWHCSM